MAQELRVASQQNAQDEAEQNQNKKKQISTQPLSSKFLAACRQELHNNDRQVQEDSMPHFGEAYGKDHANRQGQK